jgi:hypothetical protein
VRSRLRSSTASRVEELMFVRACGGLYIMRGAATPPKWDHSLEPLLDELSKAPVQQTAIEKRVDLRVHACNLARLNVQKNS